MNHRAASTSSFPSTCGALALCLGLTLFPHASLRAEVDLGLGGEITSSPSGPRYALTWDAIAAATYGVHISSNLYGPSPWLAVDLARPTNSAARWISPEVPAAPRFFRLAAPQSEIFSVEPAVFAPGTNVNLYVLGQFFTTGDVVLVDGVALGGVSTLDHTMLSVALPGQSSGTHTVEVASVSGVTSSFVVVCADATVSPELVLQGPPGELPPAAPYLSKKGYDYYQAQSAMSASRRGYDYYKAASDNAASALQNNPAFVENHNQGVMVMVVPSGEVEVRAVDLAAPGRGLDFVWQRTYRSRTGPSNSTMGVRWSHSYDVWCVTSATEVVVFDGTGRKDKLTRQPDGSFTAPGYFREAVMTNAGLRLTFADGGYWEFAPPPGGADGGKTVLVRLRDRAGNESTLGYDGAGRLSRVVDDLGRTNVIAYNPDGRISSVTDFLGRAVTYSYYRGLLGEPGAPGDLASVTSPPVTGTPNTNDFPTGKTMTFSYSHGFTNELENHLLLSIVDPLGQTAAEFVHQHNQTDLDFLSCRSVQRGADKRTITREALTPVPSNRFATTRVFLNDYVGNVTECFYDARLRCVLMREFTGRATQGVAVTAVSNRPASQLRASDPAYFETAWSWNNDSLCTRVVLPRGNSVECVYEADLNKATPPRKRGDLRVVREISGGFEQELVTTLQYDPRFGSDPTALRTRINELETILKNIGILARSSGALPDVYLPIKRGRHLPGAGISGPLNLQRLGGSTPAPGGCFLSDDYCGATEFVTSYTRKDGAVIACDYNVKGNRVKVSFPWLNGGDTDFAYDSFGGVTSVTHAADANGRRRVDTFTLSNGLVVATDVDSGAGGLHLLTITPRDAYGNMTRCTDPNGNESRFTYNVLNQCVRAETPTNITARTATEFFYDANDNLLSVVEEVRDENDALTGTRTEQFTYDARNRLTLVQRQVDALNFAPTGYAYDGNDNVVSVLGGEAVLGTDPANAVAFEYDERGLIFREIRAPGSSAVMTNTLAYTLNGHPATKQCVDSDDTTSIAYDGHDRPVTMTDAMGNVVTCTHDACGNLLALRTDGQTNDAPGSAGNIRLAESFYDYDKSHRLIRAREAHFDIATQSPVGDGFRTTTRVLAPNGDIIFATDDLGRATSFAYDTAGRRVSMWDPLSNQVEFAYDDAGNVVGETRRERSDLGGPVQVFVVTRAFDKMHRLIRSVDNVGNTNRWFFNSLGQCVKSVDPRGVATFHAFDYLGRLTMTVGDLDGDGQPSIANDFSERATWSSSNPSRLLATVDGNDNLTSFAYDALDRCTNRTSADGTPHRFVWNAKSDLVGTEDPNGTHVVMTYDANGRCIAKAITPGPAVATSTTFEEFSFDGLSRLVGHRDDDCDGRFVHDSLGHRVRETLDGLTTLSSYDSLGGRTALAYPGGRSFTLVRDALGRCSSVGESALTIAINEFDGPSRPSRISYANNMRTRIFYDGAFGTTNLPGDFGWRQVVGIRHAVSGASPIINDTTLAWDRDGNKIQRVEKILVPARTNSLALRYDPQSRLTNAMLVAGSTLVRNTGYDFDRIGNRTKVTGAACSGPYEMSALAPSPQDFQMNQYSATPCDSRVYDENGNLIGLTSTASSDGYSFDYANRLVAITRTGALLVTFTYDALGRRTSQTTHPSSLPPVTTLFVYDGNNLIEERIGTNVIASYVHLDGSRSSDDGVIKSFSWEQVRGPFSMRRGGADYFLHADDLGSIVAVTDTNAVCVERYLYDDYGAVTFLTGAGLSNAVTASVIGNPYLFHGMQLEPASQLYITDDRDLIGLREYNETRAYVAGDSVIYNQSIYMADVGRALNRRAPAANIPPIPGMCPGAMINQPVGNNPWSLGARSKQSEAKSNTKALLGGGSYAIRPREVLKEYFETGDIPDQNDFADTIDSMLNFVDDRYVLRSGIPLRAGPSGTTSRMPCPQLPRLILKDFFINGDIPSALVPRSVLKSFFQTGDKPTAAQFSVLIDSASRRKEFTGHVTLMK